MLKKLVFTLFILLAVMSISAESFQVTGSGKDFNEARTNAYQLLTDKIYGCYVKSVQTYDVYIAVNGKKTVSYEEYVKLISSGLIYAKVTSYKLVKGEWRTPDHYEVTLTMLSLDDVATPIACELFLTELSIRECRNKYLAAESLKVKKYLVAEAEEFLYNYRGLITTLILLGADLDTLYLQYDSPAIKRCEGLTEKVKELREIVVALNIMYEEDEGVF